MTLENGTSGSNRAAAISEAFDKFNAMDKERKKLSDVHRACKKLRLNELGLCGMTSLTSSAACAA